MKARSRLCALAGILFCHAGMGGADAARAQHTVLEAKGLSAGVSAPDGTGAPSALGGGRFTLMGGDDEGLVRLNAETMLQAQRRRGETVFNHGTQVRFGLSMLQVRPANVFIGGLVDADFDRVGGDAEKRSSRVVVLGGEAGRYFYSSDRRRELLLSATGGAAFIGGVNGQESFQARDGSSSPRDRQIGKTAPALGASLAARLGKPAQKGTVLIHGTGSVLLDAGTRSNIGADVNLSKRWQLGGGVRQVRLEDPGRPPLQIVQPYVRVTWGSF